MQHIVGGTLPPRGRIVHCCVHITRFEVNILISVRSEMSRGAWQISCDAKYDAVSHTDDVSCVYMGTCRCDRLVQQLFSCFIST